MNALMLVTVLAGAPLQPNWAVPLRPMMSKHVPCAVPDGGVRISSFDAIDSSCDVSPLFCDTPEARAMVLRQLDAGTLQFPQPHSVVFSGPDDRFDVPVDESGLVLFECADTVSAYVPTGFDVSWSMPAYGFRLQREMPDEPAVPGSTRLLVVNPWSKQRAVVDVSQWRKLPETLTAGRPWVTTLDGPVQTKRAGDSWFDFSAKEKARKEPESLAGAFLGLGTPLIAGDAGVAAIRVELTGEMTPRPMQIELRSDAGSWRVGARVNGHDFALARGKYDLRVSMPGASPELGSFEITRGNVDVTVRLTPFPGGVVRVVDASGKPVSEAPVFIDDKNLGITDSSGLYVSTTPANAVRASHLSVGVSKSISVTDAGFVTLTLEPKSETRVRVEAPDGGAVWGEARIFKGAPRDIRWELGDRVAIRNSELRLDGLEPGTYTVLLVTPEWAAKRIAVRSGTPQTVKLEERVAVTGIVTRAGKPVAGQRVKFLKPSLFGSDEGEGVTAADGTFRLTRALPEPGEIQAGSKRVKVKVPAANVRIAIE